jgi:hypothetical protein
VPARRLFVSRVNNKECSHRRSVSAGASSAQRGAVLNSRRTQRPGYRWSAPKAWGGAVLLHDHVAQCVAQRMVLVGELVGRCGFRRALELWSLAIIKKDNCIPRAGWPDACHAPTARRLGHPTWADLGSPFRVTWKGGRWKQIFILAVKEVDCCRLILVGKTKVI